MLRRVEGARRLIMTRAVRRIAASVEAVICSSTSERDDLIPLVRPRDQAKLRLLYNGLDLPGERSLGERHAAREQLGVAVEDVVGLFVGRLEERKAPLLAAAAARRVRSEGIPFVLLVAGEGPLANALQAEAGPHMRLLGHQQEMGRIYAAADVFLQPSEREGMSFALLEAMAHGVPAVAADGPGNPEAVGDTGIVFPAGDEVGLAEALTRLSRDGRWRAELGAAARVRVGEQFTVDRFLRDSAAVYSEALPPSPHA